MRKIWSSLRHSFWIAACIGLAGNGLLLAWLLLKPGTPGFFQAVDNVAQALVEGIAVVLCVGPGLQFGRRRRSSPSPSAQVAARAGRSWVPILLGLGILSMCLGQSTYTFYEQVLHLQPAPFPSWSDAGYLGVYPFLFLGIVLLPTSSLSRLTRSRVLLDSLMLMTAVVTFSWYFILGPTTLQGYDSVFAKLVGAAYPTSDLALVFCLLLLWSRTQTPGLRPAIWLLSLGLAVVVLTDSIYDYQTLQNAYVTGGLVDLGWPLGYTIIGLAGRAIREAQAKGTLHVSEASRPATTISLARLLMPVALIPATSALVLWVWYIDDRGPLAGGVYLGAAVLVSLVTLRQVLALRETQQLNQALQVANSRLAAMATTDPLTELPNHRALSERLEQELARARRYGHPLSLLFFDVDHFKRINDTAGHGAGDVVLQELGRQVNGLLRGGDSIGRYGGEEFLVLLPETALEEACEVAERMRKTIAEHPLATSVVKEGIPTTISLGVAAFPASGTTASEIVEQADKAMYWAKRLGRNQVRTANEAALFSRDEALAATIVNLERNPSAAAEGTSLEEVVRAKQLTTIHSLMWLLDLRDQGIFTHSYEVSDLAGAIARELGECEADIFAITTAALLHDLGKIALPDGLLYKAGPLTPAERTLIQQHPTLGAQILEVSPFLHQLMPGVAHHHENWDGSGYPDGLAGQAIPLCARIIRVAEAYQAMTTDRPYQRRRSEEEARAELTRCSGTQFDPTVVQAALHVLSQRAAAPRDGRALLHAREDAAAPAQEGV
jgi:two-component system cell cycle response regulator